MSAPMIGQQFHGAKKFMSQNKSIIGLKLCLNSTPLSFINVYMTFYCEANFDELWLDVSK